MNNPIPYPDERERLIVDEHEKTRALITAEAKATRAKIQELIDLMKQVEMKKLAAEYSDVY